MKVHKNETEKNEMSTELSQVLDEVRQLRAEVARLTEAIENRSGPLLFDEAEVFEQNVQLLLSLIQDGARTFREFRNRRAFRTWQEFERHVKPLIKDGKVEMRPGKQSNHRRFYPIGGNFQNESHN